MTKTSRTGGNPRRGFAAMDAGRQREIASLGGRAAHQSGNAHRFTSEEAREAGRKGGQASRSGRTANGPEDLRE
jgi:general stress protein YciG